MFRWIKWTYAGGGCQRVLTAVEPYEPRNYPVGGAKLRQKSGDGLHGSVSHVDSMDPLLKLMTDRVVAALILTAALPILAVCWLLIRCSSSGPAVIRHQRIGRNGRCFDLLKLRTLAQDVDLRGGNVRAVPSDPQVTCVGIFLRKLNLDELPQVWNVLRGDLSLVGPRPERPESASLFARCVPGYQQRHAVKPGITGLAQVNLPPDSNLDDVHRKLILDLEYVERSSLMLDTRLIVQLGARMLGCPASISCRILRLGRTIDVTRINDSRSSDQLKEAG